MPINGFKFGKLIRVVTMTLVSFSCGAVGASTSGSQAEPGLATWPLRDLLKVPRVFSADEYKDRQVPDVKALLFESVPFRGKSTKVFAYYSAPPGKPPAGGWPAIVIAHGGGGSAYPEYVKMWNARGYAAISMDLYGSLPVAAGTPPADREKVRDGFPYGTVAENPTEEWTYHVVSTIVLANSLIRSFPEINPDKVALVGTSWGGIHSCIVAALDKRFKTVISVYGCGFLSSGDDSVAFHQKYKDALPWWDPSHFLAQVDTPFFWIGGTNDAAFSPDMWQKSINVTPGTKAQSLVVNLSHSDGGQTYPMVTNITEALLRKGPKLPQLDRPEVRGQEISVKYKSERPLVRAELCFTNDNAERVKRVWQTAPAQIDANKVTAELPEGVVAYFVNVYDKDGPAAPNGIVWPVSSEYIEVP